MSQMIALDFEDRPRFYFTTHPRDAVRKCLLRGAYILMVASAHWDTKKQRFQITRPLQTTSAASALTAAALQLRKSGASIHGAINSM